MIFWKSRIVIKPGFGHKHVFSLRNYRYITCVRRIKAVGGEGGAGIGDCGAVQHPGTININGGKVEAIGRGNQCPGIGTTRFIYNGFCMIKITGGEVYAKGGLDAAGIGGSWVCSSGFDITIT